MTKVELYVKNSMTKSRIIKKTDFFLSQKMKIETF
ncbi:hypothetical protein SAMN05421786_10468 [Chryseobacterium ureilyticum]|uniref:Uncharacterized protein n=1 Tax=Chryseobacterium ureilyticum TaxID=373668 RepID=A0A1N7NU98_9FLAO|nr:hypothetical protein SAMN05421786_10468 [Chryseobacterium ureilyticum]